MSKTKDEATAYWLGASAGDKLIGIERRNKDLIIEISELQEEGGPVKGEFTVVEIGNWKGAGNLKDLEGKNFTANGFIEEVKIRLDNFKIKWLLNINGFKIYK